MLAKKLNLKYWSSSFGAYQPSSRGYHRQEVKRECCPKVPKTWHVNSSNFPANVATPRHLHSTFKTFLVRDTANILTIDLPDIFVMKLLKMMKKAMNDNMWKNGTFSKSYT